MTAATATRPTGRRSRVLTLPAGLRRCAVPLALLVLWQASVGLGWISTRSIPSPGQILAAFWDLTVSGELAVHLLVSLGRVSAGLAIGVSAGTVCALPAFLTGLRYALGVAWLSLVVGEQINASSGIGYLAMTAREFLRTDVIIVALIVYAILGLLADLTVRLIERSALVWRPAFIKE